MRAGPKHFLAVCCAALFSVTAVLWDAAGERLEAQAGLLADPAHLNELLACMQSVHKQLPSPDGKMTAVVFERDCGASTNFNTQVSLVPQGKVFSPADFPPVFTISVRADLDIVWNDNKTLTIVMPFGMLVSRQLTQEHGITIVYNDTARQKRLSERPEKERSILHIPPGADIDNNVKAAVERAGDLVWFVQQVAYKGPWDYKQFGPQYHAYSNFNYEATARAFGLREEIVYQFARCREVHAGTSHRWWIEKSEGGSAQRDLIFGKRLARGSEDYPGCAEILLRPPGLHDWP